MLSVILYDDSSEVEGLNFFSDDTENDSIRIITPNPNISDAFRSVAGKSTNSLNIDVITISKFIKDLIELSELEIDVKRKADLLLELSIVWRIKAPHLTYESFIKTFNTFTDLRSYTLDLNLVSEILNELDPNEAEMIQLFWLYLDQANLIDEHSANSTLANFFSQDQDKIRDKKLVLWGFTHLSGTQIDLLKSLAIENDVIIPFPREVYQSSKPTDWIKWLEVEESKLEVNEIKISVDSVFFESSNLNKTLIELNKKQSKVEVLLLQKSPSLSQINEIPFENCSYRVSQDIFIPTIKKLFNEIYQSFLSEQIKIEELVNWIQNRMLLELKNEIEKKDFRFLKVLGIFLDYINQYLEKTSQKDSVDDFDLKLLQELVILASPRTFASTINSESNLTEIRGLEGIDGLSEDSFKIICLTKSYTSPSTDRVPYSERVAEFLSSIAPVRSNELEAKLLKFKLKKIAQSNSLFLIENDILEKNIGWIRLFEDFEFDNIDIENKVKSTEYSDYLNTIIKKDIVIPDYWSASRLQTYLDCPRKYYFNYIEKIDSPRNLTYEILPAELGVLEHDIINNYISNNSNYDENKLIKLVNISFNSFIKKHPNYKIKKIDIAKYLQELEIYSKRAVIELLKLKNLEGVEIHFEVEDLWKDQTVRGSIDCLIKFPDGYLILDFKRSKNKICSQKDLIAFKKLQLWFYKNHLEESNLGKFIGMGYLSLGDLKESLVHIDNSFAERFHDSNFLSMCKWKDFLDVNLFEEYQTFEKELIEKACNDNFYSAHPLDDNACTYCKVKNLCSKGEVL